MAGRERREGHLGSQAVILRLFSCHPNPVTNWTLGFSMQGSCERVMSVKGGGIVQVRIAWDMKSGRWGVVITFGGEGRGRGTGRW